MKCVNHRDRDAAGFCTHCGRAFCSECLVEVQGRPVCRADVDNAVRQDAENARRSDTVHVHNYYHGYDIPLKNRWVAFFLCLFLGALGIHRFYVGKAGTGLLYLLTGGLCGVGYIVDLVLIAVGSFRDSMGRPLI